MDLIDTKDILEQYYQKYHISNFAEEDPIQIPLAYTLKQDQEIAGLFAAVFAWGQRKTIIAKSKDLMHRMDNKPFDFICDATSSDLKQLIGFRHRTFNDTDLLYFVEFLHQVYKKYNSLEDLLFENKKNVYASLVDFKVLFESSENYAKRTGKHLSSPLNGSACKRLNMFYRWMVRDTGIDLGIWKKIKPKDLIIPLDVHVTRVAKELGLIKTEKADWKTAVELTSILAKFDSNDPVKYDFALFGLGVYKGEEM